MNKTFKKNQVPMAENSGASSGSKSSVENTSEIAACTFAGKNNISLESLSSGLFEAVSSISDLLSHSRHRQPQPSNFSFVDQVF